MFKQLVLSFTMVMAMASAQAETIYSAETSGLVFKDKINVEMFNDPDYPNVTCYVNLPDRALDWDDQTDTAMSCVATAPFGDADLVSKRDVFKTRKNPFTKVMKVDRVYDRKNNVMVYLSYTRKVSGDNASSAITAVPVR